MPDNKMALHIDGVVCDTWDDLSVDSDIGVPADAFSFSWYGADADVLPAYINAGASCHVSCNGAKVMTGILDRVSQSVGRTGLTTNLSGRDLAGQLIDCHAPIDAATNLSLSELIKRYVTGGDLASLPITIGKITNNWLKGKTGVDVGESIWDLISAAAQASGQYVWLSADGALMIGNPFDVPQPKSKPAFYLYSDDRRTQNNVLDADYQYDVSNAFSSMEIVGQNDKGKNFKAKVEDKRMALKRHRIISDSRSDTQAEAEKFAAKAMADAWLDANDLTVSVSGWSYQDQAWATGWEVSFDSDVLTRAVGNWVIYGRTLQLSRDNSETTELRLKRREDWMQPVKYADLIKK
jgi:prophage tail gpP-like protein